MPGLFATPRFGLDSLRFQVVTYWQARVFPTRVGMARRMSQARSATSSFPHPRGDGPALEPIFNTGLEFSPPAWGWPGFVELRERGLVVFPTRVGMARFSAIARSLTGCFPHPRGDGPFQPRASSIARMFSPPAWGWPVCPASSMSSPAVFPTRVGMARSERRKTWPVGGFPHPRGDGPIPAPRLIPWSVFSPPAWGWPGRSLLGGRGIRVFPTRVGMARLQRSTSGGEASFPHPRGDGPIQRERTGRVSRFSPPAWGWPGERVDRRESPAVFPTRVGMARSHPRRLPSRPCFPHPRGDGPSSRLRTTHPLAFSPPAWGWPGQRLPQRHHHLVFPTRVGMARQHRQRHRRAGGFPHPRGDGP